MNRWMWTFVVVVCILILLGFIGYSCGRWEPQTAQVEGLFDMASAESTIVELQPCMDPATREKIRNIMYEAIDDALKEHIMKMYDVWMKDDRGQPGRAATGVRQGI